MHHRIHTRAHETMQMPVRLDLCVCVCARARVRACLCLRLRLRLCLCLFGQGVKQEIERIRLQNSVVEARCLFEKESLYEESCLSVNRV